jgi:hypothetical protein
VELAMEDWRSSSSLVWLKITCKQGKDDFRNHLSK